MKQTMKLRSGRIIRKVPTKKEIKNLIENFNQLKITTEEECKIMKESKTFFRFLFYNTCKYFGNNMRLEEIEKSKGRKPYINEYLNWNDDEAFWMEMFQKSWNRMREEITSSTLLRAFYHFLKNEHPNQLEKPQSFARMKNEIARYLQKLYHQNNSARMVKLMHQQEQVKARTFPLADKKVYFMEVTDCLARHITSPVMKELQLEPWRKLFEYQKENCRYISEVDGGYTVVKLACVNFSMPLTYNFKILETGERFTSIEKDIRKAFLLKRRIELLSGRKVNSD